MHKSAEDYSYVLITPARNEERYIELTIKSVIAQSMLPKKWIIVSDGSTDRTDEIVGKYLNAHPWVELVRMPRDGERQFAAKIHCFNVGYDRLNGCTYDIIGNLDADISFESDFLEFLVGKFVSIPELGVAGTPFTEESSQSYNHRFASHDHVSGACQLFRRECFEEIGGFVPIKAGGNDTVAVMMARLKGWETRTFKEKAFHHHRKMGMAKNSILLSRFNYGKMDYYSGWHPLWEIFRAAFHMKTKPYIVGGLFQFLGYLGAFLEREESPLEPELIEFIRKEQMARLKGIVRQLLGIHRLTSIPPVKK